MADYKTVDNAAENKLDKSTPTEVSRIIFAMAEASGVTEAGLKAALTEKIGATHVEIEDMSGKQLTPNFSPLLSKDEKSRRQSIGTQVNSIRWMWTSFFCYHRLPRICKKDDPRPTQTSEHRTQGGDCSNPCVDTEVLHTGTMARTGPWHRSTGEGDDRRSCDGNLGLSREQNMGRHV